MSERVLEGVIQLNKNLDRLLSEYNKLRNINDDMQKELLELSTKLQTVESEHNNLKRSYERIKLATALTGDGEGSREAKRKLNTLVREIDNCIALLNR
jgi:chromosome segregation ATPase